MTTDRTDAASESVPQVDPTAVVDPRALLHRPVRVAAGAVLEAGCVIGSPGSGEPVLIGAGAWVGANAVVDAGVRLGAGARVNPVSHVMRDVPPHAIVGGSPARIVGYTTSFPAAPPRRSGQLHDLPQLRVRGANLHRLTTAVDLRGSLVAGEVFRQLPFMVERFFFVFDVPGEHVRGEHAHKSCHQYLVAAHGSVTVLVDDGELRQEVVLDRNDVGLHLAPRVWGVQYRYSPGAVLLVLASDPYDADDYVRDYDEFLAWVRRP